MSLSNRQIEAIISRFQASMDKIKEEAVSTLKNCFLKNAMQEALKDVPVLILDELDKICENLDRQGGENQADRKENSPNLSLLYRARPQPPIPTQNNQRTNNPQNSPSGLQISQEESKHRIPSTFKEYPAQCRAYPYSKVIMDDYGYILDNETHKVFCRKARMKNSIRKLSDFHIGRCLEFGYPVLFSDQMSEKVFNFLELYSDKILDQEEPVFLQTDPCCAICRENLFSNDFTLYCGHRFHETCISSWKDHCLSENKQPCCPTCKTTM